MFNNLTQHINIKHIINQNLIKELDFTNKYENELKFLKSKINFQYSFLLLTKSINRIP